MTKAELARIKRRRRRLERHSGYQQLLPIHGHVCPKCGKIAECYREPYEHPCAGYDTLLCRACLRQQTNPSIPWDKLDEVLPEVLPEVLEVPEVLKPFEPFDPLD